MHKSAHSSLEIECLCATYLCNWHFAYADRSFLPMLASSKNHLLEQMMPLKSSERQSAKEKVKGTKIQK